MRGSGVAVASVVYSVGPFVGRACVGEQRWIDWFLYAAAGEHTELCDSAKSAPAAAAGQMHDDDSLLANWHRWPSTSADGKNWQQLGQSKPDDLTRHYSPSSGTPAGRVQPVAGLVCRVHGKRKYESRTDRVVPGFCRRRRRAGGRRLDISWRRISDGADADCISLTGRPAGDRWRNSSDCWSLAQSMQQLGCWSTNID